MTILAIDDNAESIKELADNLQAAFPQETVAAFGSPLWEDENCEKGCLWEWCKHRKRKTSV